MKDMRHGGAGGNQPQSKWTYLTTHRTTQTSHWMMMMMMMRMTLWKRWDCAPHGFRPDLPYDTSYQTEKSFDDDDDEDDVMKEMRLCTPWISTRPTLRHFIPDRKVIWWWWWWWGWRYERDETVHPMDFDPTYLTTLRTRQKSHSTTDRTREESIPLTPPPKDWFYHTNTPPPFLWQNQLLAPTPPPISAKAEGTPAGTTQLS